MQQSRFITKRQAREDLPQVSPPKLDMGIGDKELDPDASIFHLVQNNQRDWIVVHDGKIVSFHVTRRAALTRAHDLAVDSQGMVCEH
jgi:hypothetical protein